MVLDVGLVRRVAVAACASLVAACGQGWTKTNSSTAAGHFGSEYAVNVSRPAGGTIVSVGADGQPDGKINCGTKSPTNTTANACGPARYAWGATVSFTAVPDATYTFTTWAADCSGPGSCTVDTKTYGADKWIVAAFDPVGSTYPGAAAPASPVPTVPTTPGVPDASLAQQLAADMTSINEAYPHGVPRWWGFATGAVVQMGNDPTNSGITATAADAWGVLWEAADANGNDLNGATNTRINLRRLELWFKSRRSGQWSRLQGTDRPPGALYFEDEAGNETFAADVRIERDGTESVKLPFHGGRLFHFFADPRGTFDPSDIGGWVAIYQARLVVDDATRPDDRASARYVAQSGADYWPDDVDPWPSGGGAPAIADGRCKLVTSDWRWFAITSLSATELAASMPPLSLDGAQP